MESFASFKTSLSGKNPNLISSAMSTEKFKSSYDYLITKSQSDNQLELHHQQHQITTHHHHHHHQKQNHSMTMQIKNEHIMPSFSKSNQAPLNESSLINANTNNASSISPMPTLLPKPSAWSSHMYSFQSTSSSSNENISSSNNCISKNSASNSQQLSFNQFL